MMRKSVSRKSVSHKSVSQKTAALAISGALMLGVAAPALAGPLPGKGAGLAQAAGPHVIGVRRRHHRSGHRDTFLL